MGLRSGLSASNGPFTSRLCRGHYLVSVCPNLPCFFGLCVSHGAGPKQQYLAYTMKMST